MKPFCEKCGAPWTMHDFEKRGDKIYATRIVEGETVCHTRVLIAVA